MAEHCPDCAAELDEDAYAFWCPAEEKTVSFARIMEEGAADGERT